MQGLYQNLTWTTWDADIDTIHLLINHRHYLDVYFKDYRYFNERNIQHYPFVFGSMVRRVLNQCHITNNDRNDSIIVSSLPNSIVQKQIC